MNYQEITSRFLTIGFSRDHDAVFLNKIAQSGSEMGNFFFIDTNQPDKKEKVTECLTSSLSMTRQQDGLSLVLNSAATSITEKLLLEKTLFVPP